MLSGNEQPRCDESPRCSVCECSAAMDEAHAPSSSLIISAEDAKYGQIEALRRHIRRDARFIWVDLPCAADEAAPPKILTRLRNVTAVAGEGCGDAATEALLEADSIPQYVWPAATPLQRWIAAHSDVFAGKTVLELGSGTGAVGFTVARYARLVVLSDCSAVALAMMAEALSRNSLSNCRVAALSWGRQDHLAQVKRSCALDAFDVVIGSDVFYFHSALRSGLATARQAFAPRNSREAVFICGSVARSERMESDLDEVPRQEGFDTVDVEVDEPFTLYRWRLAVPADAAER